MMRNDTKQKTRKDMYRRILAGFCAVAIALLQCAVLLTIETEPAHAADVNVSVKTKAGSKTITTKKSISSLPDADVTFTVGEEEKHGFLLQTLFEEAVGASEIYDSIGNGYQGDYVLVPEDMKVYEVDGTGQGTSKGSGSSITYTMSDGYCPVASATISSGDFSLEVGKSKQLSASYTGDSFFESDYSKYVEWNSSNSDIATVDNTGKVIVDKAGNVSISIKSKAGESLSSVSVTGTAKPTTPPTTQPPTKPSTPQPPTKGTTKKGGSKDDDDDDKDLDKASIVADQSKLKKKTYKNSELKKLIKVRLNGEYVKKKYWKVVYNKYDKTSDKLIIEIEGKDGYTGGTRQAVYFSSTTTTRRYTGFTTRNYTPYRASSRSTLSTNTTGTTVPNITYSPDRTITVKEVFLGQQVVDEPETTPYEQWNDAMDDYTDENWDEEEMEDQLSLDFGPAAGSAAVAAAACGAGVVGRIRRFHSDMADPIIEPTKNSLDTGDVAPSEKTEKKIKLPKKFFKK